ncbi:hypothetical protein [Parabacteroides provencensis]|uniref:hypothetical protein n=1 Tax=Parabacteroides provencensis TaxID=1944636 RepID=UPI000C14F3F1|nr:hypothetical protein [Parabacteroides provencensis]
MKQKMKSHLRRGFLILGNIALALSAFAWDYAEHRKIGDRAMSLMPRYLVENGIFPDEATADSAMLTLLNMSHMPQSNAYAMNELTQLPNIVTYGTLCGLAGDHVENPLLLETGLQTHFSKTNRTLALESKAMNEFLTGASSKELLDINLAYGILAIKDLSHFYAYGKGLNDHLKMIDVNLIRRLLHPSEVNEVFGKLNSLPSMSKYFCIHIFAIHMAQEAGKEMRKGDKEMASNLMFYATLYEAFAEHFLQDSFASGHQMVRRGFSASAVCNNKSLHDFYNTIPVQTANLKGESWSAYGDKRLNQNMEEYKDANDYRNIRVTQKRPYTLDKGDSYERETRVFYQAVTATCESITEVWKGYYNALNGNENDIINELPEHHDDLPQFIYARFPVVKEFPIPFGTNLDDVPLEAEAATHKEELQLIVQEPFTRNFIRSRVANSFMFLIGKPIHSNSSGVMTYGGRLNVSMINWHKFGDGKSMQMKAGDIAQWLSPTISGYYMHAPSDSYTIKNWNVKAGLNYDMDIFVSPKRFLGLYGYMEMGVDRRNAETRFLVAPSLGIQLGSLIGMHNFNMPAWLRIPLGIILPLKFAVSCNKVAGRPVEWISNMEVDILF